MCPRWRASWGGGWPQAFARSPRSSPRRSSCNGLHYKSILSGGHVYQNIKNIYMVRIKHVCINVKIRTVSPNLLFLCKLILRYWRYWRHPRKASNINNANTFHLVSCYSNNLLCTLVSIGQFCRTQTGWKLNKADVDSKYMKHLLSQNLPFFFFFTFPRFHLLPHLVVDDSRAGGGLDHHAWHSAQSARSAKDVAQTPKNLRRIENCCDALLQVGLVVPE